jgi:hypothetical protein
VVALTILTLYPSELGTYDADWKTPLKAIDNLDNGTTCAGTLIANKSVYMYVKTFKTNKGAGSLPNVPAGSTINSCTINLKGIYDNWTATGYLTFEVTKPPITHVVTGQPSIGSAECNESIWHYTDWDQVNWPWTVDQINNESYTAYLRHVNLGGYPLECAVDAVFIEWDYTPPAAGHAKRNLLGVGRRFDGLKLRPRLVGGKFEARGLI